MKTGELHLMIIWENARYQQDKIIDDIKKTFHILECFEIEWSDQNVATNFTRFYGVKLPDRSFKEKECGRGKFLLLLLWDDTPQYETRKTSHGVEVVNVKMFDSKSKYRSWTRGGHKIHGTNSPEETNHDLTLLLGINYEDYLNEHKEILDWDGTPKQIARDLSGSNSWKNLDDLFYVLNNTITYVVMRGDDNLQNKKVNGEHADVDILVKEWQNAIYIINGEVMKISTPNRPKILVTTEDGGRYIFDLWNSSLPYHCQEWHEEMFKTRELCGSYFRLNAEHDFMSLVYHCLYHKKKVAPDYYKILDIKYNKIRLGISISKDQRQKQIDYYLQILLCFMEEHNYSFHVVKEDNHCFYNSAIPKIQKGWNFLKSNNEILNIVPYKVEEHSMSGYVYFIGLKDNQKIFVKYGGFGDSCNNEYELTKRLYSINKSHFLNPMNLLSSTDEKCIIYPWIEGTPLSSIIDEDETKKDFIKHQLIDIYNILRAGRVMHRDLRPANFLFSEGVVKLLDFQFAIDMEDGKELPFMKNMSGIRILKGLGSGMPISYRYKSYAWRDSFSIIKVMKTLNIDVTDVNLQKDEVFYMPISLYVIDTIKEEYIRGKRKIRRLLSRL